MCRVTTENLLSEKTLIFHIHSFFCDNFYYFAVYLEKARFLRFHMIEIIYFQRYHMELFR